MKKFTYIDMVALLAWVLPVLYLVSIYSSMPAIVPLHYGIDGKADRYGNKSEMVVTIVIVMVVSLGVYLLMKFLPSIDPKKQVKFGEATFNKLALGIVFFMSILNVVILYSTAHQGIKIDKLLLPLIALLFAFLGNIMHSIKPNYFAGIRTPWTLESEDTWRATHRLTSKLWFIGGIILAVVVFLLSSRLATVVFSCSLPVLIFIPIIYSYIYFKNHQNS